MKLTIEGDINQYFVQTLCMLYFPGESFSGREQTGRPEMHMQLTDGQDGITCSVIVKAEGRQSSFVRTEPYAEGQTRERTARIAAGIAVNGACAALLGYRPEWGTLTGVRPSKLALKMLRDGTGDAGIIERLTGDFLVSGNKAALAVSVARAEAPVIDSLPADSCSVYISIPFCPSRCAYCSFVSYSTPRLLNMIPGYLTRLYDDISLMFDTIGRIGLHVVSVYIGGGTPTVLTETQLAGLLGHIGIYLSAHTSSLREYTLEAGRPDTLTAGKLEAARGHGVTRISVNPQTLDDGVLRGIGRAHTCADFYRAYDIALRSGIKYINTDLIAGLPGDTAEGFAKSVDKIIELRPHNITVHTFCIKKSAEIKAGNLPLRDGHAKKSVCYSQEKTKEAGYFPYYMYRQKNAADNLENVGFSLPSCEGLYNIAMMEEVHSIFAAGAGSVTKLVRDDRKIERYFMPKYPYEYMNMDKEHDVVSFYSKTENFFSKDNIC